MRILQSLVLFLVAGLMEIGGGYLVWLWLRNDRSVWLGALGGLLLFLYGVLPTLQPAGFDFGRVYAAYGGCLLYTSPSPRDRTRSRMPSSAWKKKMAIKHIRIKQTANQSLHDINVHKK